MEENLDRAIEIYTAIAILDDTPSTPGALGFGEIVRFVMGGMNSMTPDQTRYMFSKPDLRTLYRDLKRQVAVTEMPALAAASDGALKERPFDGGHLTISDSSQPGQVDVYVRLDERFRSQRVDLILEHPTDGMERLVFTFEPTMQGELMEVLGVEDPRHARIVEFLRDDATQGTFVRAEPPGP